MAGDMQQAILIEAGDLEKAVEAGIKDRPASAVMLEQDEAADDAVGGGGAQLGLPGEERGAVTVAEIGYVEIAGAIDLAVVETGLEA
jgi:hypothetical protein